MNDDRILVRELITLLEDFDPKAVVYVQTVTLGKVALVALPNDGIEIEKRSGRFADPEDIVVTMRALS